MRSFLPLLLLLFVSSFVATAPIPIQRWVPRGVEGATANTKRGIDPDDASDRVRDLEKRSFDPQHSDQRARLKKRAKLQPVDKASVIGSHKHTAAPKLNGIHRKPAISPESKTRDDDKSGTATHMSKRDVVEDHAVVKKRTIKTEAPLELGKRRFGLGLVKGLKNFLTSPSRLNYFKGSAKTKPMNDLNPQVLKTPGHPPPVTRPESVPHTPSTRSGVNPNTEQEKAATNPIKDNMSDQPTSSNPGSGVGVKGGPKTVPSRMKKFLPGGKTAAFALGVANPNYQGSLASSGFASNPLYLPSYGSNVNTGSTNSGWSSPSSSYYKRDVVEE
ncbi:hypothetical protein ACQY0O_001111 [Thecaphora frezii]